VSEIRTQVERFCNPEKDKERKWVEEGAEVLLQLFQQFSKIAIPSDFGELFSLYDPLEISRLFMVSTTFDNFNAVLILFFIFKM
jgi:hypothetical protein